MKNKSGLIGYLIALGFSYAYAIPAIINGEFFITAIAPAALLTYYLFKFLPKNHQV